MEKAKRNQITFVFMKNIHNFAAPIHYNEGCITKTQIIKI